MRSTPTAQRQELIDGLSKLIGVDQSFLYTAVGWTKVGTPRFTSQVPISDADVVLLKYLSEFGVARQLTDDPFGSRSMDEPRPPHAYTLREVLPDRTTKAKFAPFIEVYGAARAHDGSVSVARLGRNAEEVVGLAMHQMGRSRPLTAHQVAMIQFATNELKRMCDAGYLPLPPEAPVAALSPRLVQVLDRILAGQTPKQIAHTLGLSVWTVREYIDRLYKHFQVNGREELTAKFINTRVAMVED